jgi:hypothetical protein
VNLLLAEVKLVPDGVVTVMSTVVPGVPLVLGTEISPSVMKFLEGWIEDPNAT